MNSGPTALPYQRVNTASDYDATTEDIGYGKVQQARIERDWK